MVLTVLERLLISDSLDQQGDIIFLRIRNELISKVGLSDDDVKKYKIIRKDNGGISWDPKVPQEAKIELTETECGMIKSSLVKLNNAKKLTPDHISLYEKFVENGK
jgi:hypothetical protein